MVNSILKEFFLEQDYDEVRRCVPSPSPPVLAGTPHPTALSHLHPPPHPRHAHRCYVELAAPFFGYEFVRRSLIYALERNDKEREMESRMLSM